MKTRIYMLVILIYLCLSFESCREKHSNISSSVLRKNITDVTSYTGNAIIFFDTTSVYGPIVFIIPVKEKDSIAFQKSNALEEIKGKVSIQMSFGRKYLLQLVNNSKKSILPYHPCNLPEDSMFYLKTYISYKNCKEIKHTLTDDNGNPLKQSEEDSCNSKMVDRTDSTEFNTFHIYQ